MGGGGHVGGAPGHGTQLSLTCAAVCGVGLVGRAGAGRGWGGGSARALCVRGRCVRACDVFMRRATPC